MDPLTDHNRRMWILAILIGLLAFLVFNPTTLQYLLTGYYYLTDRVSTPDDLILTSLILTALFVIVVRILLQ